MAVDTNAPTAAAADYGTLAQKLTAFMATAKAVAADGLTWSEFGELFLAMLRMVVTTLDKVQTLTGEEKKAVAMGAVASLFDLVADKAIPAAVYPLWIVIRPAVRSIVVALASGVIEKLIPMVRA
jgi:hypothetical protein